MLTDASSTTTTVAIATDLNLNASAHGGGAAGVGAGATAPLPDSIKWLLTIFLGLYVGGECGASVCGVGAAAAAVAVLDVGDAPSAFSLSPSLSQPPLPPKPNTCTPHPGFGGWISSFVLLEGATQSEAKAAFLVSIFWAAVTIGRCVRA